MLCLLCVGSSSTGCRELSDTLNAGEIERNETEANRKRFHQKRTEAKQRKMEPVLRKVKKPSKEPTVKLDPESPEGMLLAELEARIACRTDSCRSDGLQRIRRHASTLLPALPKLMSRQDDKIIVEALRLAGLFKVKTAQEAVARTLLLGDKKVQEEAVWSLGAIGSAGGIEPLRRFSTLDNPPRVMATICRSLGQIGTALAIEPIEAIFMQGTVETRVECLDAAARVGKAKAKALFEQASGDPRPVVSELAAKYLRALEPEPAEPPQPADEQGR